MKLEFCRARMQLRGRYIGTRRDSAGGADQRLPLFGESEIDKQARRLWMRCVSGDSNRMDRDDDRIERRNPIYRRAFDFHLFYALAESQRNLKLAGRHQLRNQSMPIAKANLLRRKIFQESHRSILPPIFR